MADGIGNRGIKNSLLSAATGANFFEEAAMLVPAVPIPETLEPAVAEIDLNSDDSSNRGSVEKDIADQPILLVPENTNDSVPLVSEEDKAAPISLFSRATSGVDAFTRMLAGSSLSSKTEKDSNEGFTGTSAVSSFTADAAKIAPTSAFVPPPSSNNMFPSPSAMPLSTVGNNSAQGPVLMSTPFASSITSNPTPGVQSSTFAPASSLFPVESTTSSIFSAPLLPPVSVAASTMVPPTLSSSVALPNSSFSSGSSMLSSTKTGPMNPATLTTATTPVFSGQFGGHQPPSPATMPMPLSSRSPVLSGLPAPTPPGPTSVPPPSSGGSNSFRLGGQRMKYVPCPEMQSTPAAVAPPPVLQPPMPPPTNAQNLM